MLFNSYPFLLAFLPGALAVYAIIDRHPSLRIPCLLAFSLLFYGYWNPLFVPLLVGSIVVNWLAARQYAATGNGDFDANRGGHNYGDSVLSLSSDDLDLLGSYTPTNYHQLQDGDVEFILGETPTKKQSERLED